MSEPRSLSELTRDPVTEARLRNNWRAIERRRNTPSTWRGRAVIGAGLAVAASVALALALPRGGDPSMSQGPLTMADGRPFEAVTEVRTELSDGSSIVRSDDARLSVLENSGRRLSLHLAEGRADFSVTPGGPRQWVIEAGARVEVVGTIFHVERDTDAVRVWVDRGVVLVRAADLPDGVQRLTVGQEVRVRASALAASEAVAPPSDDEIEIARDVASPSRVAASTEANEASTEEPTEEPIAELEPATDDEATVASRSPRPRVEPSAAALVARADDARARGDYESAARDLSTLLARHPDDGAAPLAAVTLGRLQLRQLGQPGRAASTLERALSMALPSTLAEDVRALRVEALARSGRAAAAGEAAAEYHRRYPSGRWSTEVARWAGEPSSDSP
ncbi:MAG: FecR domain-containing protein [Sandaracinaceae bacterium]